MAAEVSGNYLALVVRLDTAADGQWYLSVDGATIAEAIPLAPATFVVRLWCGSDTGLLRGSVRLHDSEYWALIQSNRRLLALLMAWLAGVPR